MKTRLALLAVLGCLGISLSAQASDIDYTIMNGTLSSSGTFSGNFLINPTTELIDGGQITAVAPSGGTTYTFSDSANDSSTPGLALFSDVGGDVFNLALDGPIGDLLVNTLANFGPSGDTYFATAAGTRYDATGGTITPTPEPSSLLLLGTGALAVVGSFRRRLMSA